MSRIPKGTRIRHRPDVPFDQMRSGAIKYEHGFHREKLAHARAVIHAEEVVSEVLARAERNHGHHP